MNEALRNYQAFFNDQIREMLGEYAKLLRAPVRQLLNNGQVHYAVVHGISESHGHLIFKVVQGTAPRLKVQKSFVLIKREARKVFGESPAQWTCSFKEFLEHEEFRTSSSLVLPLYHLRSDDESSMLIGCGDVSTGMFAKIKQALQEGIKVHALLYDTEPPTRYLANLSDYIGKNTDDRMLLTKPVIDYDQWSPKPLAYDEADKEGIARTLMAALDEKKTVILQGPPGSGKSYCAAQIIAHYLERNRSVCVTAMANKALMEIIQQPPLAPMLASKKLSKTMLASDEALTAKGLKDADSEFVAPVGEAVFATYYKLSNQFRSLKSGMVRPLYDLVVIEEASQAYLTTIAAALRLGRRCLVVGDPMQLSPIVVAENKQVYKKWDAFTQANGLSSFVLGTNVESYRITTTFRLTEASASLTGIFYGHSLKSVAPSPRDLSLVDKHYFPSGGGVVLDILGGGEDGILSAAAAETMEKIITLLETNAPQSELAIVTPFKNSARAIQRKFAYKTRKLAFSVETIDRIQGATVDYAILYFPLRNASFALDERRFNVATSRSRATTLILSDFDPREMRSMSGRVREFIENIRGVTCEQAHGAPAEEVQASDSLSVVTFPSREPQPLTLQDLSTLLDDAQEKMCHWLEYHLTKVYSSKLWEKGVLPSLLDTQRENVLDKGAKSLDELDFAELVSVFIYNGQSLIRVSHVDREVIDLAKHIKKVRNSFAHKNARTIAAPKQDDLRYHVMTIQRFLNMLGAIPAKRHA